MTPLFNISSSGASATVWLTRLLNYIPDVLCFHALRSNPFPCGDMGKEKTNNALLSVEEMINGLKQIKSNWPMGERSIGIVHTYYGPLPRGEFLNNNGRFMCIIRNPIDRIHSLLSHKLSVRYHESLGGDSTFSGEAHVLLAEKLGSGDINTLAEAEKIIYFTLKQVLESDVQNVEQADKREIIKFERMISEKEYLYHKLVSLLGAEEHIDNAIEKIAGERLNQHAKIYLDNYRLVETWPVEIKTMLKYLIQEIGRDRLFSAYTSMDYDLPDLFFSI